LSSLNLEEIVNEEEEIVKEMEAAAEQEAQQEAEDEFEKELEEEGKKDKHKADQPDFDLIINLIFIVIWVQDSISLLQGYV
jgi:tRNA U54 and U55 pseudouridine synthase Pus10